MKLIFSILFLACASLSSAWAGNYDCSVVYDEFDSLMNKQFLINPANYVSGDAIRLSRYDYNSRQKGKFLLKADRQGYGIAIVHTNRNTWGKFLFTWGAPTYYGQPSLILKDLTLFGRVLDGYAPRTTSQIIVMSSYTVDLDTSSTSPARGTADIWFHNVDGNTMYVEAINGAELFFPMESMCK